jgi:hypothetical protein
VKQVRFRGRIRVLRHFGTWIHFPAKGLWQETVPGVVPAKFEPLMRPMVLASPDLQKCWQGPGKPMFAPSLAVYDREIFEMSEGDWTRFLEWHPPTVRKYHATFNAPDASGGGLVDAGHFAIHQEAKVG